MTERVHPSGPLRYFHDPHARQVWAVPDYPMAIERLENKTKRKRGGRRLSWSLHSEIRHIRADNWLRPDTHQYQFPHTLHRNEQYDASDTLEMVRGFFNAQHKISPGDEITAEQYEELKAIYEKIIHANKPPTPLPPKGRLIR